MFAGGCRWPSLAVDSGSGASRGHAPVVRRPGSRWGGAVERPSAFQAGHIPSWRGSCERYALSPVAAGGRWLLPLLSAADPVPHLRGFPGPVTAPCPAQAPSPNSIAAEPDGRRVLSRGGAADHEVTPQAPLTGSGCREHSYGGFGGGHPHFLPLAPDLQIRRDLQGHGDLASDLACCSSCTCVPLLASLVELASGSGSAWSWSWSWSPSPQRRLALSSSATTSTIERALPSSAVQLRCWSRPTTTCGLRCAG